MKENYLLAYKTVTSQQLSDFEHGTLAQITHFLHTEVGTINQAPKPGDQNGLYQERYLMID